jgi:hypothetical protein
MNSRSEKYTPEAEKVDGAIRQTAEKILKRAKQTGTSVVIWEEGEIKDVPPEELELRINAEKVVEVRE